MFSSDLGRDTGYPDVFRGFRQSLQGNVGKCLKYATTASFQFHSGSSVTLPFDAVWSHYLQCCYLVNNKLPYLCMFSFPIFFWSSLFLSSFCINISLPYFCVTSLITHLLSYFILSLFLSRPHSFLSLFILNYLYFLLSFFSWFVSPVLSLTLIFFPFSKFLFLSPYFHILHLISYFLSSFVLLFLLLSFLSYSFFLLSFYLFLPPFLTLRS